MSCTNIHQIPSQFIKGTNFLLLDTSKVLFKHNKLFPVVVSLRIDPNGHILYWMSKHHSTHNFIFIQDIVDIRMGKETDKTHVNREEVMKNLHLMMTIVSNVDFTHPQFTTFIYVENRPDQLRAWIDFLFHLSQTVRRQHFGLLYHIKKKIAPVIYAVEARSINIEDLKCVLSSNKNCPKFSRNSSIKLDSPCIEKNSLNDRILIRIMLSVSKRREKHLRSIFQEVSGSEKTIPRDKFLKYLLTFQRDPRLNDRLYPPISEKGMDKMLEKLGCSLGEKISFETFVNYLWSDYCADSLNSQYELSTKTMFQPLAHYYINSSHNTFCIGLQVKGAKILSSSNHTEARADVEIYRQILLSGCRCIELDCWDGSDGVVITHGPSAVMMMNEIPLKEVCEAINEVAFKTSEYPVLLSIENHVKQNQQKKMVEIFSDIFKDKLLVKPLENHPLSDDQPLPSPYDLRFKILIKAKKRKHTRSCPCDDSSTSSRNTRSESSLDLDISSMFRKDSADTILSEELTIMDTRDKQLQPMREEQTSQDLSEIVNYLQADKVPQNWDFDKRNYVMCSLSEDASNKIYKDCLTKQANKFVKHTSKKLVRIFPANMRVTSDNYMPLIHWVMGAQLIALNFQTNCREMLMNHAMFEKNGHCGYVLKPECLRDTSQNFDIYSHYVPHRIPVVLKVMVLSASFLSALSKHSNEELCTYVTVEVFGLPPYDKYSALRTNDSLESMMFTKYSSEQMVFDKILMSEVSFVHFCVWKKQHSGNSIPIAHRMLPIDKLNNGHRNVILRSSGNRNLGPASLFVYFDVYYHVLKTQIDIHSALMDPFSNAKRNESLSWALGNPFADPLEVTQAEEVDDSYRQSIIGTTKLYNNSTNASISQEKKPQNKTNIISRFIKK